VPATSRAAATPILSLSDLAALTQAVAAAPARWQPHVQFGEASRHWSRLPSPAGVDLWLLTWLSEQSTDLHDHGRSAAALTVVQGTLTELRADRTGALSSATLTAPATQLVAPGVTHDVLNRAPEPAISIHAYSPPLTEMTFWTAGTHGMRPLRRIRTSEPEL
jgi:hypothetical protein